MLVQFPSASTSLSLCCGTEIPPDGRVEDGLSIRIRLDEILWQRKREEIERRTDHCGRWTGAMANETSQRMEGYRRLSFATESGISSVSFIFIGSLDGIRSIPKLDVALSISPSLSLNGPGHVFSSRLVAGGPRPAREDGKWQASHLCEMSSHFHSPSLHPSSVSSLSLSYAVPIASSQPGWHFINR